MNPIRFRLPLTLAFSRAQRPHPPLRCYGWLRVVGLVPVAVAGIVSIAAAQETATADQLLTRVRLYDVKQIPAHPRLVFSDANIARLRETVATPDGRQQWQLVTSWLRSEANKPVAGDPGPRRSYYGAKFDIDRFRHIQEVAEDIENHIVVAVAAYRVTGDEADLQLARRWVTTVARWDPEGATGIKADDYAARQTLYALALAYDALYAQWTPEERQLIRTSISARAADIYAHLRPFKLDEYNNHPWFQASALVDAGLALANESPDADRWWRHGAELYFTRFLPLWGRDGDWHEGINYLTFTMKYICQFANSLGSATGINPFALPGLQRAGWFRFYAAPVGSIGIYFNDTRPLAKQNWDKPIAYRLAAEARSPVLQWYASQLPTVEDMRPSARLYLLLYQNPELKPEKAAPSLPLTRYFRDSGWVIARGDLATGKDIEFGFKSSPWTPTALRAKGHDHPDANNFLLNFRGVPLLVDSGFYDYYNSPHHRGWTFTGRAHNTLLIDGQDQLIQRPGRIVGFESRPGRFDWMEGEAVSSYRDGLLQSWRRQVLIVRPDLFVIRDVVRPTKPAVITWLLHGASPFELNGQSFVCRHGAAAVAGELVAPRNLAVRQWLGFPADARPERRTPSEKREFPDQSHLEFSTSGAVGETTFVAVFSPSPADHQKRITATVSSKSGEDSVSVQTGGAAPMVIVFPAVPRDGSASPVPTIRR